MKKLVSLFLWFCAATVVAQGVILGLSFLRGNLTRKSMVQIVALMNGIDIPGERLKNAIAAGQDVPVPSRDELIQAKIQANLEHDSREKSLQRWHQQLQAEQARQEFENQELANRIKAHDELVASFNKGQQTESLAEVQRILEVLAPDQAKLQILSMMEAGSKEDVVAIIKGMPEDKRKKILAEFTENADAVKLGEILKLLRNSEAKPVSQPTNPPEKNDPQA